MKKIISTSLVALSLLSLTACNNTPEDRALGGAALGGLAGAAIGGAATGRGGGALAGAAIGAASGAIIGAATTPEEGPPRPRQRCYYSRYYGDYVCQDIY
jgi:osmotically inducible lipoprotein OsmB